MEEDRKPQTPAPPTKGDEPADAPGPDHSPEDLSADEQMARFEEALKDEDWGHQPC